MLINIFSWFPHAFIDCTLKNPSICSAFFWTWPSWPFFSFGNFFGKNLRSASQPHVGFWLKPSVVHGWRASPSCGPRPRRRAPRCPRCWRQARLPRPRSRWCPWRQRLPHMIHQRCKDVVRHVNGVSKILDGGFECCYLVVVLSHLKRFVEWRMMGFDSSSSGQWKITWGRVWS